MRGRVGFTLVELSVALVVGTVVAATAALLLLQQRRAWFEQARRTDGHATLRAAQLFAARELRGVPPDSGGGGISLLEPARLVYRASRQVRFTCRAAGRGDSVLVVGPRRYGFRPIDPSVDSLLVYANGRWRAADVVATGTSPCATGGNGRGLEMAGPVGSPLPRGTPVRVFETAELRAYRSGPTWWLGTRRAHLSGPWPSIQPLMGPMGAGGVAFTAYDRIGAAAAAARTAFIELDVRIPGSRGLNARAMARVILAVRVRNPR